ncbi:hypothetical protein B7G54_01685 [Burkholderia puraquae]|uniref:Uncharacterized protein n=1 Tax=Burkholderia puraquae TaxID=1904757 RepID=A0A1X1PPM9_9BURK|nr:hypothetical protein [Burkholderia puraquae]ORT88915.1 hypothetical protein B7G54_01685 [Burkholderia puraquae]
MLEEAADELAISKNPALAPARDFFEDGCHGAGDARPDGAEQRAVAGVRSALPSSRRRIHRIVIVYHRRFPICLVALRSSARLHAYDPRSAPRFT